MKYKLKDLVNEIDCDDFIKQRLKSYKVAKIFLIILAMKEEGIKLSTTVNGLANYVWTDYLFIRQVLEDFRKVGLVRRHTVKRPFRYIFLNNLNDKELISIAEKTMEETENGGSKTR